MSDSRLEKLDAVTRSKLRSTQILTSLPQIITELVQNSLDACSSNIEIGIYQEEWSCWVRDNGLGINKEGLALLAQGMESSRYSSSKAYDPISLAQVNTFGFRGEALASAADISCIEISSRTSKSKENSSAILKGGERLYFGPSTRWRREGAGTSVLLRDIFFNLPVRRISHPSHSRTIELIKRELEQLALMHPNVSFTLNDDSKKTSSGPDRSRILVIPKSNTILAAFRNLYGRVLVEHVDELNEELGQMKIEGFISLIGTQSKSYQFIYVNRHIMDHCELHQVLNMKFSSSTFSKDALDESGDVSFSQSGLRKSPRKGERHPVYVLNLSVPMQEVDNCLDPSKVVVNFQKHKDVVKFFADVIQKFLTRNNFRSKNSTTEIHSGTNPRRSLKRLRTASNDYPKEVSSPSRSKKSPKNSETIGLYISESRDPSEEISWMDPSTGKVYMINTRTGHSSIKGREPATLGSEQMKGGSEHTKTSAFKSQLRRTLSSGVQSSGNNPYDIPEWIREALMANKTFTFTEPTIPVLEPNRPEYPFQKEHWTKQFNRYFSAPSTLENLQNCPNFSFSRISLRSAEVIEQVDRKFIACLLERNDASANQEDAIGKTLVLIDQHAADERIRVEKYLKSLCLGHLDRGGLGIERRNLDPPLPILLTEVDLSKMKKDSVKAAFHSWGLNVVDMNVGTVQSSEEGFGMIHFSSIPEVVADKLLTGSCENLRDVTKGYLAELETQSPVLSIEELTLQENDEEGEHAWLRALRDCPRDLVNLINSRACRGAIMFNDTLTIGQCKRIVQDLAATAYPFQCAHGRPSVVPLVTLQDRRESGDTGLITQQHPLRAIHWDTLLE